MFDSPLHPRSEITPGARHESTTLTDPRQRLHTHYSFNNKSEAEASSLLNSRSTKKRHNGHHGQGRQKTVALRLALTRFLHGFAALLSAKLLSFLVFAIFHFDCFVFASAAHEILLNSLNSG
jgi:hypothetical protein